jgi:hypothetical protein
MDQHLERQPTLRTPAPSATSKQRLQRRAARTATRIAASTGLAIAISACGFSDGEIPYAPDTTAESPESTSSATPAMMAETAAPRTPGAATASRAGTSTASQPSTAATTTATQPTTTTPTSPTTAPITTTINTLDTIVSDMRLKNDAVLRGYENRTVGWYVGPGNVALGNDPRMTNAPDWFKQAYPSYIDGTYMRALLPWLVIFDGVNNEATNTRVHIRGMRAWILSRSTGEWRSLGLSPGVSGYNTGKSSLVGGSASEDKRTNADGSVEIKPPSDTSLAWHGWWNNGRVVIDPTDIQALLFTLQARLTVDNPGITDDRARSQYLVQVGADYYRDQNWSWTVPAPGVGTSRSKLVKNEWQAFSLFTFTDVGVSEPGGGITEAAFRRNPPPLD